MSAATFVGALPRLDQRRTAIARAYRADEAGCVRAALAAVALDGPARDRIAARARALVVEARARRGDAGGLDAFLHEYSLSSREGVVLMCLAEALLRIPDDETADRLIRDKLAPAEWANHLGHSESLFVNASTWGLMLTGRLIRLNQGERDLTGLVGRLVARSGEPVIRAAIRHAMRIMGRQFVIGRTIDEALQRTREPQRRAYRYSFDMLGEAALTAGDAERYRAAYHAAIAAVGTAAAGTAPADAPSISVKLSALHPRYSLAQRQRVARELVPRLTALARAARDGGVGLTVDAEEAARLDVSLDVFAAVCGDRSLAGWDGFGLAVQAYQKRAPLVIDWLAELARANRRRLPIRLVKGAYWDSEIKSSQEQGLPSYPVYTRKSSTDLAYIACARQLLASPRAFLPQFATHNAHTVAAIVELAGDGADYEFQRLHGMGRLLYDRIVGAAGWGIACRVYAPVGSHEELLPYLVRRLLENGANTSFVNRLVDDAAPVDQVIADPIARTGHLKAIPHPRIPLPVAITLPERLLAKGLDLTDPLTLADLARDLGDAAASGWRAGPIVCGEVVPGRARDATDPADRRRVIGHVTEAAPALTARALAAAARAAPRWDALGGDARAAILERAAERYEADRTALMALAVREAGKTLPDAVAELREAVDFLRYYGARARAEFGRASALPGPTGESNSVSLHGRGVFVCISPWNFPLAIFTGQVGAALAAGNAVVAKPAEQTPLMAARAVRHLLDAGVPGEVLHLLPGGGDTVGAALVNDARTAGVAFTGSTEVGRAINQALAARPGPIAALIAETGGQNAMIVDSSALPEQVVRDVLTSAFQSAGQRCSALRVLFVQDEVAPRILDMLAGAMAELAIGDPALLATDIGPVIDAPACAALAAHARRMEHEARLIYQCALPDGCDHGSFFAPRAYAIDRLESLEREVFGPILHVIAYSAQRLDAVLASINATGYGLTLGIHSRIDATAERIRRELRVGNAYVNRSMIGAVVGMQPFGGEGLSGTGPKAGGPRYLHRFAVERTLSIDTTAGGGNASLLTLTEDDDN